jgi:hypothetical protein
LSIFPGGRIMEGHIRRIKVQAYQSHELTELHLSPGMNVILGKSTAGKTAIFRAVNTLINNEPTGYRYHKRNSSLPTVINVEFDDNVSVQFEKTGKVGKNSTYTLVSGGETFKFTGFGRSVPDQIVDALNISDVNIQAQLDPHFLILASPVEIAKKLGRLAGLDKTDEWIQVLNRKILSTRDVISDNNISIGKFEEYVKKFDTKRLSFVEIEIKAIKFFICKEKDVCTNVTGLLQLRDQASKLNAYIMAKEKEYDAADALLDELYKERRKFYDSEQFCVSYKQLVILNRYIDDYEKVKYDYGSSIMMSDQLDKYKVVCADIERLEEALEGYNGIYEELDVLNNDFEQAKEEYSEILKDLSIGNCVFCTWRGRGPCPIGSKITDKQINAIVNRI